MDETRKLKMVLPPAGPTSAKRDAAADLARYIGEHHGLQLEVAFAADYRALVDDLVAGRFDAAWLPPLSLLRTERQARAVLLLERAGSGSYHGALVARRDSGFVGIADLAGKRVGWVDEDSAAGYVFTRALIAEQKPNVDAFLGPQTILGSHRAVVEALIDGTIDVGATFVNYGRDGAIVISGWHEFVGSRADQLSPIAVTSAIPGDVIAVRPGLPPEDSAALVKALRELTSDPEGRLRLANVFNGADVFADPKPAEHELLIAQAVRAGWRI